MPRPHEVLDPPVVVLRPVGEASSKAVLAAEALPGARALAAYPTEVSRGTAPLPGRSGWTAP